jgi:LysR family transcriptional regulator, low CO2-responsive transcriptional regulator
VTPTQLRAYASVVRLGSVKAAAGELQVSEAAVSMHVAQLRKEFDDRLFRRTSSGLAFTPGGLRLASRAVEILGLQDRTLLEVSQAGTGKRVLRIGATNMFAEHAAPGLIDLFASRADDLQVELSVRQAGKLPALLAARAIDVAIGPAASHPTPAFHHVRFLRYEVVVVARPEHPAGGGPVSTATARRLTWCLGPSAAEADGVVPDLIGRLEIPEGRQQIFQSDAAALEETKRGESVTPAVRFAVSGDLSSQRLVVLTGAGLRAQGEWAAMSLPPHTQTPAAAELLRFITTPRATQAMVRGAGVHVGRFRPAVHVTLRS